MHRYITGVEDTSKYPNLVERLLGRGWSVIDVEKVIGRNLLRVMRKVEEVRLFIDQSLSKRF